MATKKGTTKDALVKLVKVGAWQDPGADPACRAPAAVARLFPPDCTPRPATDGTWYAFSEEPARRGGETLRRLHWLEGTQVRRAAETTTRADPPSFDRERGVALQIKDRSKLGEVDLATGA